MSHATFPIYHRVWLASPRFARSFHGRPSACVCAGMNVRPLCRRQDFQRGLDGFRIPKMPRSYIHARAELKSLPITVGDSPSYFKCILPTSRKRGRSDTSHKKNGTSFWSVKRPPLVQWIKSWMLKWVCASLILSGGDFDVVDHSGEWKRISGSLKMVTDVLEWLKRRKKDVAKYWTVVNLTFDLWFLFVLSSS